MTCAWEPDTACLNEAWEAYSDEVKAQSLMLATSSLQMLTLNRVGTCPITVRPCPQTPRCGCGWNPYIRDGVWYNGCRHQWRCEPLSEINLDGPVGYIEELRIDGSVVNLTTGNWRLDDGHLLVWQGEGDSPVPVYQDLNKPDTESGTYSITYSKSYPVQADARIAVAYLAVEFAKGCTPTGKCKLPRGVRTVNRMGVSFTLEAGLFPNGLTGMDMVDQFILKWAPAGAPNRTAVVFDPSKNRARVSSGIPVRYSGSV